MKDLPYLAPKGNPGFTKPSLPNAHRKPAFQSVVPEQARRMSTVLKSGKWDTKWETRSNKSSAVSSSFNIFVRVSSCVFK